MILPSLRKLRTTQRNILETTDSPAKNRRIRSLAMLSAAAFSFSTGMIAANSAFADTPAPRQVGQLQQDSTADQSAAERWQSLRQQIFPASSSHGMTEQTTARPFPERTTLEQVSKPQMFSLSASAGRNAIEPVSGRHEPGQVVHSFTDSTEPLAIPGHGGIQLVSLPEFLALEQGNSERTIVQQALPPAPLPASGSVPLSPPDGGIFTNQVDTIFQPITRIQPYQNYSPTAAAEGKVRYDYVCPQPNSIPEKERVSCPDMLALPQQGSTERHFEDTQYCWVPTNLMHKPLYFEDPSLERYGQQYPVGIQPFVSLGRFGIQFLGLPYQMAIDPVHRDIYTLGYYRPGDYCTPALEYRVPLNAKAAVTAAGVYTGFAFLIP
ncbi:MAG TPA: hypothetical protein VNQ76_20785 [Planctomicrobium sp.]|nr:hypothetical protein [Planctomicrobium sp.]